MQRYLLLITPVITTKPASSDLIIRAPAEKSIQVKPRCTYIQFPPSSTSGKPTFMNLPLINFNGHDDFTNPPLALSCSASFLLTPTHPHSYPLSPSYLAPHPLAAWSILNSRHSFTYPCFSPCLHCLYLLLAWLIPLHVCGGSHIPPKLLPLWS